MKNTLALVALAAGLSQVTATGFGFHNAPSYSCPDNSDNQCTSDMKSGFNWSGLNLGNFGSYKGFSYTGYTCSEKFGKRDTLTGRSFQSKCITGTATGDKGSSPKMSCDKSQGVDKTSISEFQITPEFDCDLEFHYTMPDGSSCKHRSSCKSSGTIVKNTQCGGATDVTVVYPSQPDKPKDTCSYGIHSIGFDCEGPKPTTHHSYPVYTPTYAVSTPSYAVSSSSSVSTPSSQPFTYPSYTVSTPAETPSTSAESTPAESTPVESTPAESSTVATSSTAAVSSPSVTPPSSSVPGSYPVYTPSTSSVPAETTPVESTPAESTPAESTPVASSSTAAVSTPAESTPAESTPAESTPAESTPAESTPAESTPVVSTPVVTSYITTSTVFTTSIQTITSCGPEITNCPAGSTAVTTVTIPVSTTICPVTETLSQPAVTSTPAVSESSSAVVTYSVSSPAAESSTIASSATSPASQTSSASYPVETLPCPGVVPSCLNTWMFSVGCKDNTESSCYCPDNAFVNNIFACLYAHGESDEVISEAVSYFQGICAPYVPTNPGIATGAETITTVLTVTPTSIASYTTITVIATTAVPCTDSVGEVIPSSSSVVTISTAMTVPQVIFTTVSATGAGSSSVAIIPGTYPVATPPPTSGGVAPPYPTSAAITTFSTSPSAGFPATTAATTSPIATAGASRIGAGLGFLGAVVMAVAAL
ncbi:hypothetical protein F5Y10DRAFT_34521 [Nemania abortiva]|nr:hypothetical protein F5Y10DRAFT_34521 [Nemania abortiva]